MSENQKPDAVEKWWKHVKKSHFGALLLGVAIAAVIATLVTGKVVKSYQQDSNSAGAASDTATDSIQKAGAKKPAKTGAVQVVHDERLAAKVTEHGVYHVTATDAAGNVKWSEAVPNALTYVGQQRILKCFFQVTNCPTASTWYIGLYTNSTLPAKTATLASGFTELTAGLGYSRVNVTAWNASSNASADNYVNNSAPAQVSWTATGGSWPSMVYGMFLADAASGTGASVLSYANFSGGRQLQNGDILNVTYTLTQQ